MEQSASRKRFVVISDKDHVDFDGYCVRDNLTGEYSLSFGKIENAIEYAREKNNAAGRA